MTGDHGDMLWEAFVVAMLEAGPAVESRSRYGDKPASGYEYWFHRRLDYRALVKG